VAEVQFAAEREAAPCDVGRAEARARAFALAVAALRMVEALDAQGDA